MCFWTTIAKRFDRWLQRPQRLTDAGMVTIVVNVIMAIWTAVNTYLDIIGSGNPVTGSSYAYAAEAIAIVSIAHLLPIYFGTCMLRGKRWAAWATLALTVPLWSMFMSVLLGAPAPIPGYADQPILKLKIFSILGAMFTAQLIAVVFALRRLRVKG
jgi:hypothetical protein